MKKYFLITLLVTFINVAFGQTEKIASKFVADSFEMNYNAQFKKISQLQSFDEWQQSGLVGITRKLNIKTKLFKGTSLQLLYDMLYRQHTPVSQPFLFRVGYSFK